MKTLTLFLSSLLLANTSIAELDGASQEALDKTMKAMVSPSEREKAFKDNPKYKEGEAGADMLVKGNEAQKQQLYELAAKVMQGLAEKSKGDPAAMQEIVSKGTKNPEQFLQENFTDEQKKQVRELAAEIEKSREPKPPAPSK
jgi:hypothetical protein